MKPIVIVGAGTGGLYLANQLVLKGKNVLLIEAGGGSISSFHSSEFKSIGHNNNGISIGRSKGIGGTSNLWGGQLAEFVEDDFKIGGCFSQPIWPIDWKEVNEYYDKVYATLGFGAYRPVSTRLHENSVGDKYYLERFYTRWLRVPNFKKLYLNSLVESSQFEIICNAVLDSLEFNNDVCCGLTYIENGVKKKITDIESLVLANGTLEIVRSLLISAKKDNVPFKNNKLIGAYFQDHLFLTIGKITNPTQELIDLFSNEVKGGEKLQPKLRLRSPENESGLQISGFFHFNSDFTEQFQLLKQFFKAVTGGTSIVKLKDLIKIPLLFIKVLPIIFPIIYKYLKSNKIYNPLNSEVFLVVQAQQISLIGSSIEISDDEVDIHNRPIVCLNWKIDGRELKTIENFIKSCNEFLGKNSLGSLVLEKNLRHSLENHDRRWLDDVTDIYHHSGGAIMGANFDDSVVDSNLRVWETSNLYIIGGAVFPTSSYANTGLTILALAHRLADHLDNKLIK